MVRSLYHKNYMLFSLCVVLSYLLGSIPSGMLLSRLGGVDIRKRGSGNIGYANVQRVMGWRYGIPTLLCDITKGFVPTIAATVVFDSATAFIIGYGAIVGHVFPPWLQFRGGKGIATGLGVTAALAPVAALAGSCVYVVLRAYRHTSGTASIIGVIVLCIVLAWQYHTLWWMSCILLASAVYTLRHNIRGTVPNYG